MSDSSIRSRGQSPGTRAFASSFPMANSAVTAAIPEQNHREQSPAARCLLLDMRNAATPTIPARIGRLALSCGLVLLLLAPVANALFIVNQPWVRPAARGQSTDVYMNLTSTDGAAVVAVRSDEAAAVAIVGPGKGSAAVASLTLPAGTVVALAPGNSRLALTRLVRSIKLGDLVALTLTLKGVDGTQQDIPVHAEVRMRSPLDDEKRAHHAHAH